MTLPSASPFEDACTKIQAAYDELGHDLGWRFLTSPVATLDPETEIAFITLNPGGSRDRPDHARESSESGSAYIVEQWKGGHPAGEANLQVQIRKLFQLIATTRGLEISGDELLGETLSAQFIPFRSPSLRALPKRKESFAFAAGLWTTQFEHLSPRLVVTIDTETLKGLLPILTAKWGEPASKERFPTGWGNVTAEVIRWEGSGGGRALIRLPHLSTFKLFSRAACEPYVKQIIEAAVRARDKPTSEGD